MSVSDIILYGVAGLMAVLAVVMAIGREKLVEFENENEDARRVRSSGHGLGLLVAFVGAYIAIVAYMTPDDHWATVWLSAFGYLLATLLAILAFYWWKEWYLTLVESRNQRDERRKLNRIS